jgi:hypothetical protein
MTEEVEQAQEEIFYPLPHTLLIGDYAYNRDQARMVEFLMPQCCTPLLEGVYDLFQEYGEGASFHWLSFTSMVVRPLGEHYVEYFRKISNLHTLTRLPVFIWLEFLPGLPCLSLIFENHHWTLIQPYLPEAAEIVGEVIDLETYPWERAEDTPKQENEVLEDEAAYAGLFY